MFDNSRVKEIVQLLDHDSFLALRKSILSALWRLSRACGLYPTCFAFTGAVHAGENSIFRGPLGDVYKGLAGQQRVSLQRRGVFGNTGQPVVVKHPSSTILVLKMMPEFQSRSSHLAPVMPPKRASFSGLILHARKALSCFAVDGKWAHCEIFRRRIT
jgi:hypothetical protein